MKKILVSLLPVFICLFFSASFAQRSNVGLHFTTNEYIGDLSNDNYSLYKFYNVKAGGAISLEQRLNSSFNLVEWGGYNRVQYFRGLKNTNGVVAGAINGVDAEFVNLNLMLKYKFNNGYLLSENAAIAPFLVGGLGATYIRSKIYTGPGKTGMQNMDDQTKPSLLAGAGLHFRFNEVVGIDAISTFNRPFYDGWDGVNKGGNDIYLQHSLGLVFSLKKPADTDKDMVTDKKDLCPNTPAGVKVDARGCPIDTDADGVADYLDKCPALAGVVALGGCPDTDQDGIADINDQCPSVPGLARFAGCPDSDGDGVPDAHDRCLNTPLGTPVDTSGCALDSDGDKVADNLDKCPNTPLSVVVDANGCPTDNDKDGVPNNIDKCPNTAGPESNFGCPEVKAETKKRLNFATRGIYFQTGKAVLKPESFASLDEIVSIINEYPDYNLRLGGHTDNVGSDASNLVLSQARVDAVKTYLTSKNVSDSRLEATGYGETKPIATNKTAVGKSQNRRVEMELYLK